MFLVLVTNSGRVMVFGYWTCSESQSGICCLRLYWWPEPTFASSLAGTCASIGMEEDVNTRPGIL